jgi:hypothetical protein
VEDRRPVANLTRDHATEIWEKRAAGIEEREAWNHDAAKGRTLEWKMVFAAIAYALFILWWLS